MSLSDLKREIDLHIGGADNSAKVENKTLSIIGDEDFDKLPENIQDSIYLIDMRDIEKPSLDDFKATSETLGMYLKETN